MDNQQFSFCGNPNESPANPADPDSAGAMTRSGFLGLVPAGHAGIPAPAPRQAAGRRGVRVPRCDPYRLRPLRGGVPFGARPGPDHRAGAESRGRRSRPGPGTGGDHRGAAARPRPRAFQPLRCRKTQGRCGRSTSSFHARMGHPCVSLVLSRLAERKRPAEVRSGGTGRAGMDPLTCLTAALRPNHSRPDPYRSGRVPHS